MHLDLASIEDGDGVHVRGLDLTRELSAEICEALRYAWREHGLLLFRGQTLTREQQASVLRVFGSVCTTGSPMEDDGVSYVSNIAEYSANPYGALGFHLDNSFYDDPARGIMLYAIEAPPPGMGGETLFSDTERAYRSLPAGLRETVDRLAVRHSSQRIAGSPSSDHPLAFRHPVTGRTVLFMSGRHVERILGISEPESAELIAELATYIERPEIVYRHAWRPGDLIVWDNIRLQHARADFDPRYRRHLRRFLIA